MKHFKLLGAMSGPAQPVDIPVDVATAEYPVHAGGGYYRLSDGKTIKGRAEAEAAEKALSS